MVAYPDRTAFFGDYFRIDGYSTGTENFRTERLDERLGGDNRPTLRDSLVSGDPDLARGSEVFYYSSAGFLTVWRGQPSSQ